MLKQTIINTTEILPFAKLEWYAIPLGLFFFVIIVITIVGNVLVLTAVKREKRLQTSFNFYIVNLALTDIGVAVTAMTLYGASNVLGFWPFGHVMCGIWIFFDYGTTFASVFTLLLISIDRFWSVTWSLHYRKHNNRRNTVFLIAASWISMMVLWLPPCISDRLNHSRPGVCKWEPSENRVFVIIVSVLGHHGACFILLLCYVKVFLFMQSRTKVGATKNPVSVISHKHALHAESTSQTADGCIQDEVSPAAITKKILQMPQNGMLRESRRENCPSTSTGHPSGSNRTTEAWNSSFNVGTCQNLQHSIEIKTNKERRVFITLTYVIIGYMVCWVPFHIVFDVSAINPELVPETVYTITFWMTYMNSTINPFLYNFSSAEFRHAFKRMMCSCR